MGRTAYIFLGIAIPFIMAIIQIVIELSFEKSYVSKLHSENGPHEILQSILMAFAFLMCIYMLIRLKTKHLWLSAWIGIAALSSFYITGEEISWGQHIFNWQTPEYWQNINDQNETNLHNTSSWLDQKPRLILLIGTIVGGLIIPLLQRFKPSALPEKFQIIYPTAMLSTTAAFALFIKIIDKGQEALDLHLLTRASEVEELYLFYFVVLYLLVLNERISKL